MRIHHLLALILSIGAGAATAQDSVPYPAGYRTWTHVKSMVINEGHTLYGTFGGIHHLYANPLALTGYKRGKFPDGATIVFDLLAAKTADNTVTEGERKVVGVMTRNALKFKATGGWGFEGFKGDTRERVVAGKATEACYACHTAQKDKDYVFSAWRK